MDILRRQNLLEQNAKAEGKLLPGEKREYLISQRIARQNQSLSKETSNLLEQNDNGVSELMKAAEEGNLEKVKSLVEEGKRLEVVGDLIDMKSDEGRSALWESCSNGHNEIARYLLDNKADVNSSNNDGLTPLHMASWYGHEAVVQTLLENKASVDEQDFDGDTPLLNACRYKHLSIVKLLTKHQADINKRNEEGDGPMSYLWDDDKSKEILEYLKRHQEENGLK